MVDVLKDCAEEQHVHVLEVLRAYRKYGPVKDTGFTTARIRPLTTICSLVFLVVSASESA